MRQYIGSKETSTVYSVDFEKKDFNALDCEGIIDYAYIVPEDGEFLNKDTLKVTEVKEGDILIKAYSATDNYEDKVFFIVPAPDLANHAKERKANSLKRNCSKTECATQCERSNN